MQKSGYFARSAPANADDLRLIQSMVDLAVDCALRGESGVIGHDEERGGVLRAIEFPRIKGGKPFDIADAWFGELLQAVGQPVGARMAAGHEVRPRALARWPRQGLMRHTLPGTRVPEGGSDRLTEEVA